MVEFLTLVGLNASNLRSQPTPAPHRSGTESCSLYGRVCQGSKAIDNGLFIINNRDTIHRFLTFSYMVPYADACALGFWIVHKQEHHCYCIYFNVHFIWKKKQAHQTNHFMRKFV
jgi:hypothetical protein